MYSHSSVSQLSIILLVNMYSRSPAVDDAEPPSKVNVWLSQSGAGRRCYPLASSHLPAIIFRQQVGIWKLKLYWLLWDTLTFPFLSPLTLSTGLSFKKQKLTHPANPALSCCDQPNRGCMPDPMLPLSFMTSLGASCLFLVQATGPLMKSTRFIILQSLY